MELGLYIESLIFAAAQPIKAEDIKATLEQYLEVVISDEELSNEIDNLIKKYQLEHSAVEVVEISDGFTFMTKGAYHGIIGTYLKQITNKKLSRTAMETLAIIAYKQPVTKTEMEEIRGVNCDYSIQKLLDKELIEITGRSEGIGKPLLYGTSEKFMDYFGLKSMDDLPTLSEFETLENSVGIPPEAEVHIKTQITNEEE